MSTIRRRLLIGGLVGMVAFGSVFGMAATLGGMTGTSLGADSGSASSCDSDGVTTSYTTAYDSTDQRYEVTAVVVAGINNNCDGKTLAVTVSNSGGTSLGSGSVTIASNALDTDESVTLSSAADAEAVANVHAVISG